VYNIHTIGSYVEPFLNIKSESGRQASATPRQPKNHQSLTEDYTPRKRRAQSPPPYSTSPRKTSRMFFPEGANSRGPAICAVCLGIFKHDVSKCSSDSFWDGSKARCRRNDKGRIINPAGLVLCVDWQRPNGCSASGHNHECSGCGKQDHGAQKCSRAQTN
jgi:hypothetical protein